MIYTHVMKKGGQGVQSPADRINIIQDKFRFLAVAKNPG